MPRVDDDPELRSLYLKFAKRNPKAIKNKIMRPPNRSNKVVLKSSYYLKTKKNQKRNYKQKSVQKTKLKDSVQQKSDWTFVADLNRSGYEIAHSKKDKFKVEQL